MKAKTTVKTKYKSSYMKELATLCLLFLVLIAISLPITLAWFTDSKSIISSNQVNFGAIEIDGTSAVNLYVGGTNTAYTNQAIYPGKSLDFKVELANTNSGDGVFLLAGCGVSVYHIDKDSLTLTGTASEQANQIIEASKTDNSGTINMTKVFTDVNRWMTYTNVTPTDKFVDTTTDRVNYWNMVRLEKGERVTLTGSMDFLLAMQPSFLYNGEM